MKEEKKFQRGKISIHQCLISHHFSLKSTEDVRQANAQSCAPEQETVLSSAVFGDSALLWEQRGGHAHRPTWYSRACNWMWRACLFTPASAQTCDSCLVVEEVIGHFQSHYSPVGLLSPVQPGVPQNMTVVYGCTWVAASGVLQVESDTGPTHGRARRHEGREVDHSWRVRDNFNKQGNSLGLSWVVTKTKMAPPCPPEP